MSLTQVLDGHWLRMAKQEGFYLDAPIEGLESSD